VAHQLPSASPHSFLLSMACIDARRLLFSRGEHPVFTKNPIGYLQHMVTPYDESEKAGWERTKWFNKHGRGLSLFSYLRSYFITVSFAQGIPPSSRLNPKPWATRLPTPLQGCSPGSTRSSITGLIVTPGPTTKVRFLVQSEIHFD
jgi:hypothetical protein